MKQNRLKARKGGRQHPVPSQADMYHALSALSSFKLQGLRQDPGEAGVSSDVQTDGSWVNFRPEARYFPDVSRQDPANDRGGYDTKTDAMAG